MCVFPLFSKDFRGSAKRKTLAFFGENPCFFQKSKDWRVRGDIGNFYRYRLQIPRRYFGSVILANLPTRVPVCLLNNAKSPVGMTDLKIKRIFWGIGNFYRYRLQILANLSGEHFGWNGNGCSFFSTHGEFLSEPPTWGRQKGATPISPFSSLIFLSLPFWTKQGKPPKRQGSLLPAEPLKSLGKKGKNTQNRKEFLETEKGKENQKARKRRLGFRFVPICVPCFRECPDLFRSAPFSSNFFRFVFRTTQNKAGKPLSADPFCKSPILCTHAHI